LEVRDEGQPPHPFTWDERKYRGWIPPYGEGPPTLGSVMRYSLTYKIKGQQKWLNGDDYDTMLLIATMMKHFHLPFQMLDHRTVIMDYKGE
jgi:hypothetical protein